MHQLEFTHVYDYSGQDESVILPVVLRSGPKQVRVAASVDTGASFCLFGAEIAEALGLLRRVAFLPRGKRSVTDSSGGTHSPVDLPPDLHLSVTT